MIRVTFESSDRDVMTADGAAGDSLLDIAQSLGLPLEGACEGAMACATCHVFVSASDLARLPRACRDEEEMLDLVPDAGPTSRLACQIVLTDDLETLAVTIPASAARRRR